MKVSQLAVFGALAAFVDSCPASIESTETFKPVGKGRVVGSDNGKSRVGMPIKNRNALCECGSGKKRKKCFCKEGLKNEG
tara:strand:+ start:1129 stop:1368 length:240 start_codon:yes stop_codon:yes gene_type:complete